MCGIFCEISCAECVIAKDKEIMERIKNRGPDSFQCTEMITSTGINITFCGSVLWMQGPKMIPQPLETENGILLYNGDIFEDSWNINISDTEMIMEKLCNNSHRKNSEYEVISILKSLKGPFSIIYYDKINQKLYYTRDRIGRNTLLFYKNDKSIVISSVLGRKYNCVEIPATHMHILNLKNNMINLYQWDNGELEIKLEDWFKQLQEQQNIPDDEFNFDYDFPLDFRKNDNVIEYIETVARENKDKLTVMEKLIIHPAVEQAVKRITSLLLKSVEIRLKRQPNKCKQCVTKDIPSCNHCTVGILFSGGLDCTIIALMADKYLPPDQSIYLINVAFRKDNSKSYDVPDRITGLQSLKELQRLSPLRNWVFKSVNISKDELETFQACSIADLVYPRQTILDESLGTALWFASRGQDDNTISTSRVLLLGSGADELFGGYIRHRKAFKRLGWVGLSKELHLDWKRISFRNLARDNRVICDHGRQPRMPYLDDDFTEFVLQLDPWLKCFPSDNLGLGIGDKLMLRLVAHNIGLKNVAILPKRALQFGSRIANKNEKGQDLSKNLLNK